MANLLDKLDKELPRDLIPETLEAKYRKGDFLVIAGLRFRMSYYSMVAVGKDKQQSRWVAYTGNGLTISLDFLENTIEIAA